LIKFQLIESSVINLTKEELESIFEKMLKTLKFLVFVLLVWKFCSVNSKFIKIYIECDPSEKPPDVKCPVNSICVELGENLQKIKTGLCACKVNYTVNRNYSSVDQNSSQYCIENLQESNQPISTTTKLTWTSKFVPTTSEPSSVPESTQNMDITTENINNNDEQEGNKESKVYYNPIGLTVTITMICVLLYVLYRVIKANHHVTTWTQKKQVINDLKVDAAYPLV